jgi:4a-hydroxytetrahydrobiopterin dehydratase
MADLDDLAAAPIATNPPPARLDAAARAAALAALGRGWTIEGDRLRKAYKFSDFASALRFVDAIGAMSDAVDHHPDVELGWGRAVLSVWTHVSEGITAADFAWAARAERLAPAR